MPSAHSAPNPYRSPAEATSTSSKHPSPPETPGVGIASMVIMTCGGIYLLAAVAAVPLSILMFRAVSAEGESYTRPSFYVDSAIKAIIYELAFAAIGSLLLYAGWSVRKRKNYWVGIIGSVVGCLPLPLVVLSFFPSAWVLWSLTRPKLRKQFGIHSHPKNR